VSDRPSLAIVIVSYNVRDELDACLASIAGRTNPFPATITVVDNGSSDGTTVMLQERWPAVMIIDAGGNVGFSRANNLGIRATRSDYVLLLNPDTVVMPGAIQTLMGVLVSDESAAAAGPRLIDEANRAELSFGWSIGPFGELRQRIAGTAYRRGVTFLAGWVERWTREPGPREWVSGACLLVRRSDLEAVGLLDERYFMYTEDVDLCVALRHRGRRILFVPQAEVRHLRGRSAGRNPDSERLRRRSQRAYYAKHHPRWLPVLDWYLKLTGRMSSRNEG
jgi:N-acetylglucosaminyl-diphospho-decaprenol L-rhamnosyltransferase